jgi:hypothetical protein
MLSRVFLRGISSSAASLATQRRELLLKIYGPAFEKLEKNQSEYWKLARSGRVWEDYYTPGDSEKYGYFRLMEVLLCR